MGALTGLLFAAGVLLVLTSGGSRPERDSAANSGSARRLLVAGACGLAAAIAGLLVTGLAIVAGLSLILGFSLPRLAQNRAARRRVDQRREAWPDAIDNMVTAVRAGMSLAEAMCGVAVNGPACLREDFAHFAAEYRLSGNFNRSMLALRERLADPIADRVVEAMLTAREVGGHDLGKILRTLGEFVRQDLRLRGEAEARRSWTVNGARLAAAAPWVVLAFLSSRPGTVAAYQSPLGSVILCGAATATVLAYWLMVRIGRLPDEPRVLAAVAPQVAAAR